MSNTNISLIITVLNEEKTIVGLLDSIVKQSLLPDEIVIVDGGSSDTTYKILNDYKKIATVPLVLAQAKGNRSIGRNKAIEMASYSVIAITDAGCTLDLNWLSALVDKYDATNALVIAGYYQGVYTTYFQQAVIPYALVMPDRVNPSDFLPATRSMLLEKNIWKQLGGFDQTLSDNEDYAFAKKIKKNNIKIQFTEKAVVYWQPPETLYAFFRMIYRFARGDIFAGIFRPKVGLIFARYVLLTCTLFFLHDYRVWLIVISSLGLYCYWSIAKNKKYVGNAWYWLPVLQVTSDIAVMMGSIEGLVRKIIPKAQP